MKNTKFTEMNREEWEEERRREDEWNNQFSYGFDHYTFPVELPIVKTTRTGQVLVECDRCKGTGTYSFNEKMLNTCMKCLGSGTIPDPLITDKQIAFIRQLFKAVREMMTIDEQEELIAIMKAAISKTKRVNRSWAGQTIDQLKKLQNKRSAS
jgi:hypothetical protein